MLGKGLHMIAWHNLPHARTWVRSLGVLVPIAAGYLLGAHPLDSADPTLSGHPLRALAMLLALGVVSGLLLRSWASVLVVPVALLLGLSLGGALAAFNAVAIWPLFGQVDIFFLALILYLIPPAIGAAVGTAVDISLEHGH